MDLRGACFKFYWKVQKIVAPSLKYSQAIYEDILTSVSHDRSKWLDLGCGHRLLPPWRLEQERLLADAPDLIVGLDYDDPSLRKHGSIPNLVRGDASMLPFPEESFDLVTSNMMFEHLAEPEKELREIFRILKPGGVLLFHTPNANSYGVMLARATPQALKSKVIWLLQHRKEEDVFPTHYRMNTEKTIRGLAGRVGFRVTQLRLIVSSAQLVMIPPLVIAELFLIRFLMTRPGRRWRTNIIGVFTKPDHTG